MLIGCHASHKQFSPGQLLDFVQAAELACFQAIMTTDHMAPWSEGKLRQQLGFGWAAMAKTSLPYGSLAYRVAVVTIRWCWRTWSPP